MKRLLVVCLLSTLAAACGEKEVVKPDPQTESDLKQCRDDNKAKQDLIARLEKENAELKLGGGAQDVTVTIEGDVLTVSGKSGPVTPGGDAKDEKLYEAFVKAVRDSRGSIKKCYQQALKKNSALQARTVTLNIQVTYKSSGAVTSTRFDPRISDTFDKCMETVAQKWNLPAFSSRSVTFQTKLSLTPE